MGIPNSEKRSKFKKGYVILFFLGISFLQAGFVIITVASMLHSIDYEHPDYERYIELLINLNAISTLFLDLGLGFFLLSNFVGAMIDKRLSIEVKRGMLIASFLGFAALIIFNYLIISFRII